MTISGGRKSHHVRHNVSLFSRLSYSLWHLMAVLAWYLGLQDAGRRRGMG